MDGLEFMYWQVYFKLDREEHEREARKSARSTDDDD
jgi:hypothetical protein